MVEQNHLMPAFAADGAASGGLAGAGEANAAAAAIAAKGGGWPMPVAEFLAGGYVRRADVVLTRKRRDFRSLLIRWATNGSFSHAALMFLVPHQEQGFNNSFVIEAASGGVDLTNFADYLNDRRSVVGIRRLSSASLAGRIDTLVRGRMLNSIKARYSYRTAANIVYDFANQLAFGVKSRVFGAQRAIADRRQHALAPPNQFICSGLVQLGYVHAVAELIGQTELPPSRIAEVVFRKDLERFLPQDWEQFTDAEQLEIMWDFVSGFRQELEAATPEDLATSPRLRWVYIIRNGLVYPAESDEQAHQLLTWRPRKDAGR